MKSKKSAQYVKLQTENALARHETTIEKGIKAFVEVGQALLAIRDGKLFKPTYGTFTAYVKARWPFKLNYAMKVIRASSIALEMKEHTGTIVPNELQARELAKLDTVEQRTAAWEKLIASGENVTAETVKQEVEGWLPDAPGDLPAVPELPDDPPEPIDADSEPVDDGEDYDGYDPDEDYYDDDEEDLPLDAEDDTDEDEEPPEVTPESIIEAPTQGEFTDRLEAVCRCWQAQHTNVDLFIVSHLVRGVATRLEREG